MRRAWCWATAVSIFLALNGINCCAVSVLETFAASKDFSSVQGENNWYYQQYDGKSYKDMVYDSTQNLWRGDAQFLLVFPNSHHPSDGLDSVRKFVTPSSGTIRITGIVSVPSLEGDGVVATILQGRKALWSQLIKAGASAEPELYLKVKKNEAIYFSVNCNENNAYDTVVWDPLIEYVSGEGIVLTSGAEQDISTVSYFNSAFDFDGEQGTLGWEYMYGIDALLNFNEEKGKWSMQEDCLYISGDAMYPGEKADAVRRWTSKRNGDITIRGTAYLDDARSNGATLKIFKGDKELYSTIIQPYFSDNVKFSVKTDILENQQLYFVVGGNGSPAFDNLKTEISIDFSQITVAPVIDYGYDDVIIERFDSIEGFGDTQGANGWFYEQHKNTEQLPLVWSGSGWRSSDEQYLVIEKEMMHPGKNTDAVRKWVAYKDGFVAIRGKIGEGNPMSDGVIATVTHNGRLLWKNIRANRSQRWNDPPEMLPQNEYYVRTYVKAGDSISFALNCRGNSGYDSTQWNTAIDYISYADIVKPTAEFLSSCDVLSILSPYAIIKGKKVLTETVVIQNGSSFVSKLTADALGLDVSGEDMQMLRNAAEKNGKYVYWHESGLIFISDAQMNTDALNYAVLSEIYMLINNEEAAL